MGSVKNMRICSTCILPETFPMVHFDAHGVCNYCHDYNNLIPKGEDELRNILSRFKNKDSDFDCIVGSGAGRDSVYVIHQLVKEYNMRVLMVTYDWGLMTPEAHRNWERISRVLDIKHIIVRPDTEKIKKHIAANIKAWLKRPHLGMVPMFTAADKPMEIHINRIAQKYNIKLAVSGTNRYETTHFRTAFCGVNETKSGGMNSSDITNIDKAKMLSFYLSQYIRNPRYINSSLPEMIKSFFSYYIYGFSEGLTKIFFYDYILWDEEAVLSTIRKDLDWESPKDTVLTWRTDDGTAPFYNYLYYTIAGFTENDTFRSNQIRQGVLTRDKALELVKEENKPRYEAIKKYLGNIGLDYDEVMEKIDEIPKLFSTLK